jgi:hypothetical protein
LVLFAAEHPSAILRREIVSGVLGIVETNLNHRTVAARAIMER